MVTPSCAPASCRLRLAHRRERHPGPRAAVLGHRLELRAAAGQQRELDGDEEAVGERAARGRRGGWWPSPAVSPRSRRRAAARGSAQHDGGHPQAVERGHLDVPALVAERLAHGSGMWPSRSSTKPASVSYSPSGTSKPQASNTSSGWSEPSSRHSPGRSTPVRRAGRSCSSSISPTISSSTSSRVMIPAVPPCSSTTTARWLPRPRRSASRSPRPRVSGTTKAGGRDVAHERGRPRREGHPVDVLHVDDAAHVVEVRARYREPGVAGGHGPLGQCRHGVVHRHGVDGARAARAPTRRPSSRSGSTG